MALPVMRPRTKLSVRQIKRAAAWAGGLFLVFLVFAWINMPTKAIAWRMSQEAKKAGMIVDIGDVRITPFGRVTLYDVTWSFPPARVDEASVPFVAERVDMRVAPLRYLWGNVYATMSADLDEGHIEGSFSRRAAETNVHLDITELPLYAVPKFQQTLNAPVRGEFAMAVDLTAPDNHFEDATGTIEVTCRECSMGDGATKLYVPGAKKGGMLEKGMTVPEIDFGELHGRFDITDGVAKADEFVSNSDDITIEISGEMRLHDPFGKSEFDMIIKVFVSEQLQEASPEINLMVATSGKSQKLLKEDLIEGQTAGLGYKLIGTVGRPKLKGIYSKSRAQRLREARDRRQRAEERRAKAAAERKRKEAERKAEADANRAAAAAAGGDEPEEPTDGDDSGDDNVPQPRLGTAAVAPAIIPEAGAGEQPTPDEEETGEGGDEGEGDDSGDEPDEGAAGNPEGEEGEEGEEGDNSETDGEGGSEDEDGTIE